LRKNAKVHRQIFDEIKKIVKEWTTWKEIDELCGKIAKNNDMICWFKWVYDFPNNICISVNDVVVHWTISKDMVFKNWDLVTFDFWVRDKRYWVNTDAAFSVIVGWDDKNLVWTRLLETNKKALKSGIEKCRVWNTIGDIWYAIQNEIENAWFKVVKNLSWHCIWKTLHEKPYIYNYGNPWSWAKIQKWMVLCIEPILWETSGDVVEEDDGVYIKDWSLGSQFEHTVLITDWEPEIIV
jgi:methionyl aminopeptidase